MFFPWVCVSEILLILPIYLLKDHSSYGWVLPPLPAMKSSLSRFWTFGIGIRHWNIQGVSKNRAHILFLNFSAYTELRNKMNGIVRKLSPCSLWKCTKSLKPVKGILRYLMSKSIWESDKHIFRIAWSDWLDNISEFQNLLLTIRKIIIFYFITIQ